MQTPTPSSPKQLLRREITERLGNLDAAAVASASREACARLMARPEFASARRVMLFVPIGHELDPARIALECQRLAKTLWLPRTNWETREMVAAKAPSWNVEGLVQGRHGLREPAPSAEVAPIDTLGLILVPGLAFDPSGGRLGRGAGFYDRFLADLRHAGGKASFVALALDEQILESVPMDRHDVFMDLIVTPTRTPEARPGNI
jgi:5-formyltetrahydrofolate cyclo-ligase